MSYRSFTVAVDKTIITVFILLFPLSCLFAQSRRPNSSAIPQQNKPSSLESTSETRPVNITFNELSQNTNVTNQFKNKGVVFTTADGSTLLVSTSSSKRAYIVSIKDNENRQEGVSAFGRDPIAAAFFEPATKKRMSVSNVSFELIGRSQAVQVTWYEIDPKDPTDLKVINQKNFGVGSAKSSGLVRVEIPDSIVGFTVELIPLTGPFGCNDCNIGIGNLSFTPVKDTPPDQQAKNSVLKLAPDRRADAKASTERNTPIPVYKSNGNAEADWSYILGTLEKYYNDNKTKYPFSSAFSFQIYTLATISYQARKEKGGWAGGLTRASFFYAAKDIENRYSYWLEDASRDEIEERLGFFEKAVPRFNMLRSASQAELFAVAVLIVQAFSDNPKTKDEEKIIAVLRKYANENLQEAIEQYTLIQAGIKGQRHLDEQVLPAFQQYVKQELLNTIKAGSPTTTRANIINKLQEIINEHEKLIENGVKPTLDRALSEHFFLKNAAKYIDLGFIYRGVPAKVRDIRKDTFITILTELDEEGKLP